MTENNLWNKITWKINLVLITLLVFSNFGCPLHPTEKFDTALIMQFEQIVQEAIDTDVAAAVAGVWVEGKGTWHTAQGLADIDNSVHVDIHSQFRVGSITKTFTAMVVLQLIDEGWLQLDDTVDQFRADVPNGDKITIKMLLNHSSGLAEYLNGVDADYGVLTEPLYEWSPDEQLSMAFQQESYFEPGTGFAYSNTNYVLLGLIIESVSGRTASSMIQTRLIEPLQLYDTFLAEGASVPETCVRGYQVINEDLWVDVTETSASLTWTAGAMISTLYDLKVWAQALGECTMISTAQCVEQYEAVPVDGMNGYGLGISMQDGYIGHNGAVPGYNSEMRYWPDSKTTIIVLQNTLGGDTGAVDICNQLADALFLKIVAK